VVGVSIEGEPINSTQSRPWLRSELPESDRGGASEKPNAILVLQPSRKGLDRVTKVRQGCPLMVPPEPTDKASFPTAVPRGKSANSKTLEGRS